MEQIQQFLPEILSAILMIIAVPIGTLIGIFLKKCINQISNDNLKNLAEMGVSWASEQFGKGVGRGREKHEMVYNFLKEKTGLDDTIINAAIKASVISLREARKTLGE
jgi:hypothetical protein